MKFTTCQSDLDHALRTIAPSIGVRSSHPILDCCLIRAAGSAVTITGYNLSLGITSTIPAAVETDGAVALPYKLLAGIVGRLEPDQAVTLTDGALSASGGSYGLAAADPVDYPALPAINGATAQLNLSAGVRACLVAASTDEAKQLLTGVNIADGFMAATDGHRLVRYAIDLPADLNITLPASTIRLLADHSCSIQSAAGQAVITTDDNTTIYSRTLDGTYPNVAALIPADFQHVMTINRHRLTRALERVAIIAEATNGIVKLAAADHQLVITAEADANNGREALAFDGVATGNWAFNVRYLLDGLKVLKSAETIDLCCNAATTPVVLRASGFDDVTYLVMPVQIKT